MLRGNYAHELIVHWCTQLLVNMLYEVHFNTSQQLIISVDPSEQKVDTLSWLCSLKFSRVKNWGLRGFLSDFENLVLQIKMPLKIYFESLV